MSSTAKIPPRFSHTELGEIYFWTATIKEWHPLLKKDENKEIIIESLKWLCEKELVRIYAFVIMPNHIHLVWMQLEMNGNEFPKSSLLKYTAHQFAKKLISENDQELNKYKVSASDRRLNFWQRDPMAVLIFNKEMAFQKIDYMHHNPLQEHWKLCDTPEAYHYSSASFYEGNKDEFGILTHIMDEL